MPLITLSTNRPIDNKAALCQGLSAEAARILDKPESYVMAIIRDNETIQFAGTDQPAAYLQLKSLGLREDMTQEYSRQICTFVSESAGIPSERIYIEFSSPPRHYWGWNGSTFS